MPWRASGPGRSAFSETEATSAGAASSRTGGSSPPRTASPSESTAPCTPLRGHRSCDGTAPSPRAVRKRRASAPRTAPARGQRRCGVPRPGPHGPREAASASSEPSLPGLPLGPASGPASSSSPCFRALAAPSPAGRGPFPPGGLTVRCFPRQAAPAAGRRVLLLPASLPCLLPHLKSRHSLPDWGSGHRWTKQNGHSSSSL